MSGRFYIQDTRNYLGDSVLWWGPDRSGYTINIDEAGLYEEDEARRIEKMRGTEKAFPEEVVLAAACRHVRADRLRAEMTKAEQANDFTPPEPVSVEQLKREREALEAPARRKRWTAPQRRRQ